MSDSIMGNAVAVEMAKIIQSEAHADMFYKKAESTCECADADEANVDKKESEDKEDKEENKQANLNDIVTFLIKISSDFENFGYEKSSAQTLLAADSVISEANKKTANLNKIAELPEDLVDSVFDETDMDTHLPKEKFEDDLEDLLQDQPADIVVEEVMDNMSFLEEEPSEKESLSLIAQVNKELDDWIKKNSQEETADLETLFKDLEYENLSAEPSIEDIIESDKPEPVKEEIVENLEYLENETDLDHLLEDLEKELEDQTGKDIELLGEFEDED